MEGDRGAHIRSNGPHEPVDARPTRRGRRSTRARSRECRVLLRFSHAWTTLGATGGDVGETVRQRDVVGLPGLRPARKARGLTQEELTRRTRVDRSTISLLENGVRDAHFGTIRRLAAALDVPVAQLLLGDDYSAPVPQPPPAQLLPTLASKRRRRS